MAVRPKLISLSAVVAALLFAAPLTTSAQPAARVPSVGSLSTGLGTATSSLAGDLAALGYVEGKTIILHLRYSERRVERLPALAVELVQLNVDVIVAWGVEPSRSSGPGARDARTRPLTPAFVRANQVIR